VRSSREKFSDDGSLEAFLDEAEGRTKASSAGSDNNGIILMINDCKRGKQT
jgi:hypothetical protein